MTDGPGSVMRAGAVLALYLCSDVLQKLRCEGDDIVSAAVIAFTISHSANSGRSVKLRRESFLTYSKTF
jgi:hypothetical protein